MEAPPPFLVILFLPPLSFVLCLQHEGAMTLLLHYWLASSGDPLFLFVVDFLVHHLMCKMFQQMDLLWIL
jgi:hypothetical protein